MPLNAIREFFRLEAAAGLILVAAAALALVLDNSPLAPIYDQLLTLPFTVQIGNVGVDKPILLWINDGLMAVFFLLVGLELKREAMEGQLSSFSQVAVPGMAAIGGMAVPASIYAALNWGDPIALQGWAIPAATDIAFALGVLALLGSRVPLALKVFVTAVAIIDDIGAILIIAIFYTADLSTESLGLASLALVAMFVLNRLRVAALAPYILIGMLLWIFVLKSGVHATLAGVAIAFAIPMNDARTGASPLRHLEHILHPWVAYCILPVFAFANAGIYVLDLDPADLLHPVPLGIALGLFFGKQIGAFGMAWIAIKLGMGKLPEGCTMPMMYGACILTGIGFTMSLFIGGLAFEGPELAGLTRLGIILGSLASAIVGYSILRVAISRR